jgi:3-hydroxyisobutyrate dehydrogenase-like beta-hydroxyacid dehydrogenase
MRVAVVGLGLMGEPIARRLLAAGHELTVFNRTAERARAFEADGATVASSAAEVWETADVCVTMVANDAALEEVTASLLGEWREGRVLVDMSTVSPAASARVAAAASAGRVDYLRAPVSGNPTVVRAGNLSIMVSGDRATFERVEPVLRDVGPNVFHVGDAEQARVLKLALNMMIAGIMQLMAEAVVFAEANGLDRATLLEVAGASAVGSPFVKYKTAPLVARDYTTTFSVENLHKDLQLALGAAADARVALPTTALLDELVQACIATGLGDTDLSALLPQLQRTTGVASDL